MTKYHINSEGKTLVCRARTIETCTATKIDQLDEHYETKEAATKAYEKYLEKSYAHPKSFRKPLNIFCGTFNTDEQEFDEQKYIENSHTFMEALDDDDKQALRSYVRDSYHYVNSELWGKEPDESTYDIKKEVEALDRALVKSTVKPPNTVWRSFGGSDMNKIFHERGYKVGEAVEFKGYTSTTETPGGLSGVLNSLSWYMQESNPDEWETEENSYRVIVPEEYAENGAKGRNTILCIRPKSAAPVSMFRGRSTEQEWLMPRGSKFRISEIYENTSLEGGNMHPGTYAHIYVLDEI